MLDFPYVIVSDLKNRTAPYLPSQLRELVTYAAVHGPFHVLVVKNDSKCPRC